MQKSNNRAKQVVRDGESYGYWTIIGLSEKDDYIKCHCLCGTLREVNVYSLTSGKSRSCGCMRLQEKE